MLFYEGERLNARTQTSFPSFPTCPLPPSSLLAPPCSLLTARFRCSVSLLPLLLVFVVGNSGCPVYNTPYNYADRLARTPLSILVKILQICHFWRANFAKRGLGARFLSPLFCVCVFSCVVVVVAGGRSAGGEHPHSQRPTKHSRDTVTPSTPPPTLQDSQSLPPPHPAPSFLSSCLLFGFLPFLVPESSFCLPFFVDLGSVSKRQHGGWWLKRQNNRCHSAKAQAWPCEQGRCWPCSPRPLPHANHISCG